MTEQAYIFDAIRTPRGKGRADGALNEVKPVTLLAGVLEQLRERNRLNTAEVEDIVMGCVSALGDQGADLAKIAAAAAGWDDRVSGVTLNRFCGSGLEAVNLAAAKVRAGFEDLVVAGGFESMSRVPMGSAGGPMAHDPETSLAINYVPQGVGADLIATLEGFSRADVDCYAAESHRRAAHAWANGYFDRSVVPVRDRNGLLILERDECIRPDSSIESLAKLKPAFEKPGLGAFDAICQMRYPQIDRINHVHTAANSSGIVDGAAALLIGSADKGRALGLKSRARIVSTAVVGTDPTIMLTGPAPAARKALAKAGLGVDDIDLFEVNEAFASVVLKFQKELGVGADRVNVNGGAIAMGHPLGATGAMLLGTLLDELERREQRYGLATLCIAGGMGIATIIERV